MSTDSVGYILAQICKAIIKKDLTGLDYEINRSPLSKNIEIPVKNSMTGLMFACSVSDQATVNYFLDRKASLSNMDKSGRNSLHFSAQSGNINTLKLVLNKAAQILNDNAFQ